MDCRTTIDEFTGADRLVRLRWPARCPVLCRSARWATRWWAAASGCSTTTPATMPSTPRTTLDAGQPGPRLVRAVLLFADPGRRADPAVSVAEVVASSEESAPDARDLMVALVRAGVTATCSTATHTRYGHLDVDSNLPDTRIALGGPDENPFTAAVLAAADPSYAAEVTPTRRRHRRVFVPASARWTRWAAGRRPARCVGAAGPHRRRRGRHGDAGGGSGRRA